MNESLKDTIFESIDEALANLHTSTIAKVIKVSATSVDVKPVFNRIVDGQSVELPTFTRVMPFTLSGGSSHISMPIAIGDYCILMFTERCTDSWASGSDFVAPLEHRMHDYSDGFAFFGLHNLQQAKTIPIVIEIKGNTETTGNDVRTGDTTQTGNKGITGEVRITGGLWVNGIRVDGHNHVGDNGGETGPMK